jgi:hypothetical protein
MEQNKYNNIPQRNSDYSSKPHWQSFNDYACGQWGMDQKDSGPRPMRAPAYTPSRPKCKTLTPEQKAEFLRLGKCYICEEQGHISRDCPK